MSHFITQSDIDELRKSDAAFATQMMFGSFGKGASKKLTAVWNIFTDERYLVYRSNEDREIQWQAYLHWLSDKIIGLPQATDLYTVEQLINMNYVGVYKV